MWACIFYTLTLGNSAKVTRHLYTSTLIRVQRGLSHQSQQKRSNHPATSNFPQANTSTSVTSARRRIRKHRAKITGIMTSSAIYPSINGLDRRRKLILNKSTFIRAIYDDHISSELIAAKSCGRDVWGRLWGNSPLETITKPFIVSMTLACRLTMLRVQSAGGAG
ncbi:hypothetical protein BDR05DRAFT_319966 [Suillus weaverae]|nr:hypothetical protein BDR05DRAFT_319966 [Suillus weaverae]